MKILVKDDWQNFFVFLLKNANYEFDIYYKPV